MWKWIRRIIGGVVLFAVVVTVGFIVAYLFWLPAHQRELIAGSQIAKTRLGEIEYALAGDGIPLLRIHGSPGGYDQSIIGPRARPEEFAGFKIIAPSRPGYLRTPLTSGRTPAEQADLYAALLDALAIKRVVVYGVSGGGSSALQFALRHPDRTVGLIMVVPHLVTEKEYVNRTPTSKLGMFAQDIGAWSSMQLLTESMAAAMLPKTMPGFDAGDALQMAQVKEIAKTLIPAESRFIGRANDIEQYRTLGIDRWPLESLSVPTLILHGNADENAPYRGSLSAATRIPKAELVTFEEGNHFIIITRAREIKMRIQAFINGLPRSAADAD